MTKSAMEMVCYLENKDLRHGCQEYKELGSGSMRQKGVLLTKFGESSFVVFLSYLFILNFIFIF